VLALPRGGVPVAAAVARILDAPFDFILVRKLGAPGFEELAIGAVAEGEDPGVVLNRNVIKELGVGEAYVERATSDALREISRRRRLFRAILPAQDVKGRTAIIVDDGLATGATMEAAIISARRGGAQKVVAAVPVAPADAAAKFEILADHFVTLAAPATFAAVGAYYDDFRQLADADVIAVFREFSKRRQAGGQ
jgi:predicted phosphoribosyltransferase